MAEVADANAAGTGYVEAHTPNPFRDNRRGGKKPDRGRKINSKTLIIIYAAIVCAFLALLLMMI